MEDYLSVLQRCHPVDLIVPLIRYWGNESLDLHGLLRVYSCDKIVEEGRGDRDTVENWGSPVHDDSWDVSSWESREPNLASSGIASIERSDCLGDDLGLGIIR